MTLKTYAMSIAFLAALAGSGVAADLPSLKAPVAPVPPPPPPPMWTGFYVGVNAGGTWANSNNTSFGAFPLVDDTNLLWFQGGPFAASATGIAYGNTNAGFIGGGQIGYNYQFSGSVVVGVEADIQGIAGNTGSSTAFGSVFNGFSQSNAVTITRVSRSLDYIGTVRGRLGWLVTPTLLIYGTGGFAYGGLSINAAQVSYDDLNFWGPGFGSVTANTTGTGWTAGGGLEWMFMPNWSAKVEYLYYDLGTRHASFGVIGPDFSVPGNPDGVGFFNAVRLSSRFNGNIVRAGVNYHFNWGAPAPVVARY